MRRDYGRDCVRVCLLVEVFQMTKIPQSLCEFLAAQGGIRIMRGQFETVGASDLRAIGADNWHRGAPFRQKLMRLDSGLCPDDAALAAWEAGYLACCVERPEIQDLIDAVERELHGRPVYTLDDEQAVFEAEMAAWEREQATAAAQAALEPVPGRAVPLGASVIVGCSGDAVALYQVPYVTKKTRRHGFSLYAKAFRAGEAKHAWHHVFPDEQARLDAANAFFAENMEGAF
jgi:hypothetical protein